MPKKTKIDFERFGLELRRVLFGGPLSSTDVCRRLGVSQPTFSRYNARSSDDLLAIGKARKTMYALKRAVPDVSSDIAIYEINESGKALNLGNLSPIHPNGFYFGSNSTGEGSFSRFFDDLPYFLDDLRPNGFLGRLIPITHPDLNLPKDINIWAANDCLKYLTRYGTDLIGNIILGDEAFERYLNRNIDPPTYVPKNRRDKEYPKKVIEILQYGDPGSSAGGEQSKFPALVGPEMIPVLVKFSPKVENNISQRRADLLICEHLSLNVIGRHGRSAATSRIIASDNQLFLEVERFDRVGPMGRKGLISLNALSAEFVGKRGGWTDISKNLLDMDIISREVYDDIRWRELFGHLIGNTDMHLANLSFYFQRGTVLGLAPAYDMLPMLYAPQNEQIIEREFSPPLPGPSDADIWKNALAAAEDLWNLVSNDARISQDFKKIAQKHMAKVSSLKQLQGLLP